MMGYIYLQFLKKFLPNEWRMRQREVYCDCGKQMRFIEYYTIYQGRNSGKEVSRWECPNKQYCGHNRIIMEKE